jgi:hypothetical protein
VGKVSRELGIEGTTYFEPPKRMSSLDFSMAEDLLLCDVKRTPSWSICCSRLGNDLIRFARGPCILPAFQSTTSSASSMHLQPYKILYQGPNFTHSLKMDFRDPSRTEESDDAILNDPYRPFYSLFGGQPILVKQYEVISKETRSSMLMITQRQRLRSRCVQRASILGRPVVRQRLVGCPRPRCQ